MRRFFEGYLVLLLLVLAIIYITVKSFQFDQTVTLLDSHQLYINKLTVEDFETPEKVREHLDHINNVRDKEFNFYKVINDNFLNIALIIFGCAAFQTAFLISLHKSKKTYNQQLHRTP